MPRRLVHTAETSIAASSRYWRPEGVFGDPRDMAEISHTIRERINLTVTNSDNERKWGQSRTIL